MEMLDGVWKQHLRPRAVVGYGVKIFLPSLPNYVTRSPGKHISKILRLDHFRVAEFWRTDACPWQFFLRSIATPINLSVEHVLDSLTRFYSRFLCTMSF